MYLQLSFYSYIYTTQFILFIFPKNLKNLHFLHRSTSNPVKPSLCARRNLHQLLHRTYTSYTVCMRSANKKAAASLK